MKLIRFCRVLVMTLIVGCGILASAVFAKAPATAQIVFTSSRHEAFNRDIYVMATDGRDETNLTAHPADDFHPAWSPTGAQILFVSDRGGVRDLHLMSPDGSNVRRVFKVKKYRESPTWSPDGQQFAYVHVNWWKRFTMLYLATLGAQEEEALVEDADYPAWSPDGMEIACSVGERLTFVNVRTGAQKRLLPKKAAAWQRMPSWDAAGHQLVFVWNEQPIPAVDAPRPVWHAWQMNETIYRVNRDGTGLQQLVEGAQSKAQYPALSPNGEEVLYTQEVQGVLHLFKLEMNTGLRTQLTHQRLRNLGGAWFDPAYALPVSPHASLVTTTWGKLKTQ